MKHQHQQKQQQLARLFLLLLLALTISVCSAATRYTVSGPILTITLKEPTTAAVAGSTLLSGSSSSPSTAATATAAAARNEASNAPLPSSWFDWSKLSPTLLAGIQSQGPPLPKWLPALQSIRAGMGYTYNNGSGSSAAAATSHTKTESQQQQPLARYYNYYLPTWLEVTGKFALSRNSELQIQPSYQFATREVNLQVQLSQGAAYLFARLSNRNSSGGGSGSSNSSRSRSSSSSNRRFLQRQQYQQHKNQQHHHYHPPFFLQALRGSVLLNNNNIPALQTFFALRSIRISPTVDLIQQQAACTIEAIPAAGGVGAGGGARGVGVGTVGRTKAVLHLERQNPTLTVVYALNDRNVIAPEINLYNGRMMFQWNCELGAADGNSSSSSIRTKVDPLSAIQVTWTDASATGGGGGKWITDVRLPLQGNFVNGLAADIRVRRQFTF